MRFASRGAWRDGASSRRPGAAEDPGRGDALDRGRSARPEAAEATNAAAISPLNRDLDRLQAGWQLLNSATAMLTEESSATASAWYLPWARRLLVDRGSIQRQRGHEAASESTTLIDEETRSIDEQEAQLRGGSELRIGSKNYRRPGRSRGDDAIMASERPHELLGGGLLRAWFQSRLRSHDSPC